MIMHGSLSKKWNNIMLSFTLLNNVWNLASTNINKKILTFNTNIKSVLLCDKNTESNHYESYKLQAFVDHFLYMIICNVCWSKRIFYDEL